MPRRPERRRAAPGGSGAASRGGRTRASFATNQRRREDRRAIIILVTSLAAVMAAGAYAFVNRPAELDPETGCIAGRLTPESHTVILVDQTDSLTARQIDYAKTLILLEYERLAPGDQLTVRPLDADPDSTAREFSRCRVRRGSEVNAAIANPDLVEQSFRRTVGDALNTYLDGLAKVDTASASPIAETLNTVAEARDFGPNVAERRLVMVSDMAQHSPAVDQYATPGAYDLDGRALDLLPRNLRGVQVRVHYVRRPELNRLQTANHQAFWQDWFERAGAQAEIGWGLQLAQEPSDGVE